MQEEKTFLALFKEAENVFFSLVAYVDHIVEKGLSFHLCHDTLCIRDTFCIVLHE